MAKRLAWSQFEGNKTLMWRAQQLHDAGLDEALAAAVATSGVDLHYAVHVVKSGTKNGVAQELIFDLLAD